MKWKTHLNFAIFLSLGFYYYHVVEFHMKYIFLAIVFSLLPDIDKHNSKISRNTRPLSWIFNLLKHRTFTHSILFILTINVGFYFLYKLQIIYSPFSDIYLYIFANIGLVSHLVLDSLTKGGTMPFYPFSEFKIRFIFKTGELVEWLLLSFFSLANIILFVILI